MPSLAICFLCKFRPLSFYFQPGCTHNFFLNVCNHTQILDVISHSRLHVAITYLDGLQSLTKTRLQLDVVNIGANTSKQELQFFAMYPCCKHTYNLLFMQIQTIVLFSLQPGCTHNLFLLSLQSQTDTRCNLSMLVACCNHIFRLFATTQKTRLQSYVVNIGANMSKQELQFFALYPCCKHTYYLLFMQIQTTVLFSSTNLFLFVCNHKQILDVILFFQFACCNHIFRLFATTQKNRLQSDVVNIGANTRK
jgi:hypothetical protein